MADQLFYQSRGSAARGRTLGITRRATPLPFSWTGEMRVRFSDFQVNEIGPDGVVIHLRQVGVKEDQKQPNEASQTQESLEMKDGNENREAEDAHRAEDVAEPTQKLEVPPEDIAALTKVAGESFAQAILEMFQSSQNSQGTQRIQPVTSDSVDDKFARGQIHQEVRRIFQSKIDTNTTDDGAIIAAIVPPRRGKKRLRGTRERREDKPGGEYLHFTLFKDNRDTMDAVNQIARMLRTKPQSIGYAGTKDRRASTVQRCSVRYAHQRSLAGINGKLWGMATGDYAYSDVPIHLGRLLGNEFVITLKNCRILAKHSPGSLAEEREKLEATVGSALAHMADHGWINYFGHQRFGTHQIGTHDIGKLILADKFEEAVSALLEYDPEIADKAEKGQLTEEQAKIDDNVRHQACMLFRSGRNINKAVNIMPRRFSAEVCVLRHLSRHGSSSKKDYVGAITHITRGLRSMYLHAYQSYVWNHAASKRWQDHGEKVIPGDLMIVEQEAVPLVAGQDQDGDDIINPVEDDDETPVRARPLTADEASSGNFTIYDIVLPTPGHDVIYPDNDIGDFYREFMGREENGSLNPHKMQRMRREFSLPGRYRKLMNRFLAKPSIEFRTYSDDTEQMHPTDMDLFKQEEDKTKKQQLNGGGEENCTSREDGEEPAAKKQKHHGNEPDSIDDQSTPIASGSNGSEPLLQEEEHDTAPSKIAAIVKFQLGRSAYATVTLRELMGDSDEEEA